GRRLFPTVIDDLAASTPDRIIYEYVRGKKATDGLEKVSCQRYANAISRAAWFLDDEFGQSPRGEVIGYIGPGDVRYLIFTVAAVKTGRTMLFLSPKNSLEGHRAVLESAECHHWLANAQDDHLADSLFAVRPHVAISPSLDELLRVEPVKQYPYRKSFEEARQDPCWMLHTSGSTGLPKPVTRYMPSTASNESHLLCGPIDGQPLLIDETIDARVYVTFPLFHSAGLSNALLWPIYCNRTAIFGPHVPLTTTVLEDMMDHARPDIILTAPLVVEDMVKSESTMERLSKLRAVSFGGGPLSQEIGDVICQRTKLILIMGTSEAGWLTCVDTDRQDWNYLHFHPKTGLELRSHPSGLSELWAVRKPELTQWQTVFTTFPNLQEYCFKDLFSPHPTKKDLWHYEGRADNIIVLSSGEKFNPTSMELVIGVNPLVSSVLICGQARLQIAAIMELADHVDAEKGRDELLHELAPAIRKANEDAPKHAQLSNDYIIFASRDKPFLRAGKGTVQKQLTLDVYQKEIDDMYTKGGIASQVQLFDASSRESLVSDIRKLVVRDVGFSDLDDNYDFFAGGADSLQAISLLKHIRSGMADQSSVLKSLNIAVVYEHPSVNALTDVLFSMIYQNGSTMSDVAGEMQPQKKVHEMKAMLAKYSCGAHSASQSPAKMSAREGSGVVILTGSTGSLGSYMLDQLISAEDVREIWCLNRSSSGEERQTELANHRGLRAEWSVRKKVHFRQADLSKVMLGLDEGDYQYLKSQATHIIHNQWQVDFNLSLASFEPHVAGVHNLIRFWAESSSAARLAFVSSVGVAEHWVGSEVPEEAITDLSTAAMGYGQSKLVAEALIVESAVAMAVPSMILRVGQIAGPVGAGDGLGRKGVWKRNEWFPTIIKVSRHLGVLPASLGKQDKVTWIPVDVPATVLLELTLQDYDSKANLFVYNLTNPREASWNNLFPVIQRQLAAKCGSQTVEVVPWEDWVALLESAATQKEASNNVMPGIQLLPFFQSMNHGGRTKKRFATAKAQERSPTLRGLEPVDVVWMETWMEQWDTC
ncbi:uncharacterized protein B0I36DRAFT_251534, partial [Microdochium trichocladiopsis]